MNKKITYNQAFDELQNIIKDLENEEISIDDLSEKVKRAAELIRICKAKITTTEEDVKKILEELGE